MARLENGISRRGIEITWDFFCLKLNLIKLNKFDCARFSMAQTELRLSLSEPNELNLNSANIFLAGELIAITR